MANISVLNNVHNFYMTTYADKSNSPYDAHKKSELRNVYHSIVKINKDSPLYLLDDSQETKAYAIGLKENARSLRNTIASLGGLEEDTLLNKKKAYSSNEHVASASFIGQYKEGTPVPSFDLEVKSLATGQVNMGRFLLSEATVELPPDTYSFDININDLNYEFQFNIKSDDTNQDIQNRLARLINNSNIGLSADVVPSIEHPEYSYLRLDSQTTGLRNGSPTQFRVSDDQTSKTAGAIDYLGIDYMTRGAQDAHFMLNGEEHTASSNSFTVGKMYEVTLKGRSEEDESAHIGLKNDVESLTENINTLLHGYNQFLQTAAQYTQSHPKSKQLMNEMTALTNRYMGELTDTGIRYNLDGTLELDEKAFQEATNTEDAQEKMTYLKDFTTSLLDKSKDISLNPMVYVDKTVVAYKNPGKNFATPYITSSYSGLLFNSYC